MNKEVSMYKLKLYCDFMFVKTLKKDISNKTIANKLQKEYQSKYDSKHYSCDSFNSSPYSVEIEEQ